MESTLAGVCTFATGSAQCGSGENDPIHVTTICGEMLDQAVKTLKANPGATIRLVGHRNPSESATLAKERAEAVAKRLASVYGVKTVSVETGAVGPRTVEVFVQ